MRMILPNYMRGLAKRTGDSLMNVKKGQRQHYVPQFLLRNWRGPDCKVGSFRKDLPGMPYSRCGPKATGYERGVNSLKGVREADIDIVEEKVFGPIDNNSAQVINKLLKSGLSEMANEDVEWLLIFAASLELRHPDRIEGAEEIAYSAIVDGLDDGSELDRQVLEMMEKHPEIASNLPLKNLGPHILNQASILRKELPSFALMDFTNERDHLLLSDLPLIRTNGVEDPNVVVALPISPCKAVLGFKTPKARDELMSHNPPEILLSAINRDSLYQAITRIYALDETHRSFLEVSLGTERRG